MNNLLTPFLLSLFVALGIGLMVGMEREVENLSGKEHFTGMRGFAFMSILGCVVAYVSLQLNINIIIAATPAIFVFISVFHVSKIQKENFGIVTELSLILVFFLGVLAGLQHIREALAVAVVASIVLAIKNKLRETIQRITQEELYAFVKFFILSLLLLPFLPDKDFGPEGLLNLQGLGIVIVIVSSLSFIGYFIIKFFGATKGIFFTAFFGGTFSSTAVTWVFSSRSKENESLSTHYSTGILIACSVMFIRVLVIAGLFNIQVFHWLLLPCALMILSELAVAFIYHYKSPKLRNDVPLQLGNPLDLKNVLFFALQYVAITFLVYYANKYLGTKGLFVTGFISGLADVDAINISVSKLSLTQIRASHAAVVILFAILSNTFFKIGETILKGSKSLQKKVIIGLIPSIVIIILSMIWIYVQAGI